MRVAIFGAGGVGAYVGGRLAANGAEVQLIARGAHLDAIREHGLRVESIAGDLHVKLAATADAAELGTFDIVLVCVKSYDTEAVAEQIAPLLASGAAVLSLQNGVDNEEKLARAVGPDRVLGGIAYVFATIKEPGVITHTDGPGAIVLGELDGRRSSRALEFAQACTDAAVPAECVDDIESRLWQKFSIIIPQAGMTALSRAPIGAIRENEAAWAMFLRLADETLALAGAEGIELPGDQRDRAVGFVESLVPGTFSSLHYDLVHGKRLELDALHGYVARRSREHGLGTPACDAVVAALAPHVDGGTT